MYKLFEDQDMRLSRELAACILIDLQTGLLSLVQDYKANEFKNNVMALAACADFFKLPTIVTTSLEHGPNGPLLPEIAKMHAQVPVIRRNGQINPWDNEEFISALKKTGRKQLLIAGISTDVCVAFCALSAAHAGFQVYVVTDACGTFDEATRFASWLRMGGAGVQLINWFAAACEIQSDWRNDMDGLARLVSTYMPGYANLLTNWTAAERGEDEDD